MQLPQIFLFLSILSASAAEPSATRLTALQRVEREQLKATAEARVRFARERRDLPSQGIYDDVRAVIHVHAEDSNHTGGTRREVLEAAKKTGVRVVMFTDHDGPKSETWRGLRDGVLFIAGHENTTAGLLGFPRSGATIPSVERELRFLSHVEERSMAASDGFAGMEICNRHTDAILDRQLENYVRDALPNPERWTKLAQDFKDYPDEFFAAGVDYRTELFGKWDQATQTKRFTGIGANDAHQNQTFQGVTFDPYEVSFRNLSTHLLLRELTQADVFDALEQGRAYVSHDWLCDPTGFTFGAANNLGVFTMGDEAPFLGTTRIFAITPLPAHLKLFRNGELVEEAHGTNLTFRASNTGAYRLEAWLTLNGEERPWIYANPVYLKLPTAADLSLPSPELAANVEARKDIVYFDGDPADAGKHKLDLYLPAERRSAPVFFFVHGGAWKSGDRSQYPAVANRFAKEGIITVVPSYRLAPKHPHPAQIEDVAAAFAWVIRHIAEHGGDPKRVIVGGHSAGGHLAALLSLDESYLKAHGLSRKDIRGTIALSGVYDLSVGESQASVFGTDPSTRRNASPVFHLKSPAAPFLVTYCQWDYLTLPLQARHFHAALVKSGTSSELVYIPGESHISEMIHVPKETDPTAIAILKFIRAHTK